MDALLIADALTKAITTRDIAGIKALYAPETTVWHSYDQVEQTHDETVAFLEGLFSAAAEVSYTDIRKVRTEDGFVQQHRVHIQMKDGASIAPRPACIVAKVTDGKIVRVDEYVEGRRTVAA